MDSNYQWLPLEEATQHFGYNQSGSLRRRIRELRERGQVIDLGNAPPGYKRDNVDQNLNVVIYWPNPRAALIRSDAPRELLNPKLGKRARKL